MSHYQPRRQTKQNLFRRGALTLVLASSFALNSAVPAQAWGPFKGLFSGDTQGGASGNSRGGATRDEFCESDTPVASAEVSQPKWQISALVPQTAQQTMQSVPSIFVYLQQKSESTPQAKLSPQLLGTKQGIQGIELEDIKFEDLEQFDESENVDLLLQLELTQNNNSDVINSYYFSLPTDNTLVKLPITDENAPLVAGQSYEWTLRLLCRQVTPQGKVTLDQSKATSLQISETEQSALFGEIARVPDNAQVQSALTSNNLEERYQTYLDNELWFELVSDVATVPTSTYWNDLLELWNIPAGEADPQVLLPLFEE
ncbi:protein of unknown function DUF928 [[Leptolyngbya] sp. PCC 7376]|uniref:DUF928 domain-containing protein n=1 Tax=[Leptolyngbya] sp. PCC 7376 TaxID=111781 RepID=UPI00029EF897|nr:DUF928 domain-containing protein [[Leptolyngbya] sp. PCC 7376]AFY38535.1 protein of unknown function DUF928 [[Leptolyngbya] sp. PCC 7376]